MFSDPSYDAPEIDVATDLPYDVRANHASVAHALGFVGSGTVTVKTAAGFERPWTVINGQTIPCGVSDIISAVGVTKIRVHVPQPADKTQDATPIKP